MRHRWRPFARELTAFLFWLVCRIPSNARTTADHPAAWDVTLWYIDPQNVTTCADDANTGTSPTCSAGHVGPLHTTLQLVWSRLECGGKVGCPQWIGPVTYRVKYLSVGPITDPITLRPSLEQGAVAVIEGTPQLVATGTLSSVIPKVITPPQELTVTLAPGLSEGVQVVNASHPSMAWVKKALGGSVYVVTQPLPLQTLPEFYPYPMAEVDSWTNGDSFTAQTLTGGYLTELSPSTTTQADAFPPQTENYRGLFLYNFGAVTDPAAHFDYCKLNASSIQSYFPRYVHIANAGAPTGASLHVNDYFTTWVTSDSTLPGQSTFLGGGLAVDSGEAELNQVVLDLGVRMCNFNLSSVNQAGVLGDVYLGAGCTGEVDTGFYGIVSLWSPAAHLWGPGDFNASGTSRVGYQGDPTLAFQNTGTLFIDHRTTACNGSPTSLPTACGITLTPASLKAPQSATGFGGTAWVPAGAGITNQGEL
jgi:hypothetical protein